MQWCPKTIDAEDTFPTIPLWEQEQAIMKSTHEIFNVALRGMEWSSGRYVFFFFFSSHLLNTTAVAKKDGAQIRTFAHGCQPGCDLLWQEEKISVQGNGRGLVDAGWTQLPRGTG